MAHDSIGALDLEVQADLTHRRSVTAPLDLAADEIVNFALTRSKCIQVGHGVAPCLTEAILRWLIRTNMRGMYSTYDQ